MVGVAGGGREWRLAKGSGWLALTMGGRKRKKPAGKGRPTGKFFFFQNWDTISDERFVDTGWSGNVSDFFVKILKENSSIYRKNINSNP